MALVTVAEAAKLVGITRQQLYKRYLNTDKDDRLTSTKNNAGVILVDTAELIRVFGEINLEGDTGDSQEAPEIDNMATAQATVETTAELALLRQKVEFLEELWKAEKHRADNLESSIRLLEHRQQDQQPPPAKPGFFSRLFGRG